MTLLASPLESIESAVIWLLVVFSVATWGLALLKGVQFGRLKAQDRKFHKQFWAASSLDSAAELARNPTRRRGPRGPGRLCRDPGRRSTPRG